MIPWYDSRERWHLLTVIYFWWPNLEICFCYYIFVTRWWHSQAVLHMMPVKTSHTVAVPWNNCRFLRLYFGDTLMPSLLCFPFLIPLMIPVEEHYDDPWLLLPMICSPAVPMLPAAIFCDAFNNTVLFGDLNRRYRRVSFLSVYSCLFHSADYIPIAGTRYSPGYPCLLTLETNNVIVGILFCCWRW